MPRKRARAERMRNRKRRRSAAFAGDDSAESDRCTPEHMDKLDEQAQRFDGFLVATAQISQGHEGAPEAGTVVGHLPCHAPYMRYQCLAVREHTQYGWQWRLRKVLHYERLPDLTPDAFAWVLYNELALPPEDAKYYAHQFGTSGAMPPRLILERLRADSMFFNPKLLAPGGGGGAAAATVAPESTQAGGVRTSTLPSSAEETALQGVLALWYGGSGRGQGPAKLAAEAVAKRGRSAFDRLAALVRTRPWRLAFKVVAKAHYLPKPFEAAHVARVADPQRHFDEDARAALLPGAQQGEGRGQGKRPGEGRGQGKRPDEGRGQGKRPDEGRGQGKRPDEGRDTGNGAGHGHASDADKRRAERILLRARLQLVFECYDAMCGRCAKGGHLLLHSWQIDARFHAFALPFLVEHAGVVRTTQIGRTVVYWPLKYYEQAHRFMDQLGNLWARFHERGAHAIEPAEGEGGNPKQRTALQRAAAQPLLLLTGMPGTGKTWVIERLVGRWPALAAQAPDGTALCTLTGAMRAGHQRRGMRLASTIHRLCCEAERAEENLRSLRYRLERLEDAEEEGARLVEQLQRAEARRQEVKARLARIRLLVLDEPSNVGQGLLTRLLDHCPNLERLALVFDADQTQPMKPGRPCVDLLEALPGLAVRLEQNMRTSGTAAHRLVENDRALLERRLDDLQFDELVARQPLPAGWQVPGDKDGGALLVRPASCASGSPAQQRTCGPPADDLRWLVERLCPADVARRQVLVLRNDERAHANAVLDRHEWSKLLARHAALFAREAAPPQQPRLYRGQRIALRGRNVPACVRVPVEQLTGHGPQGRRRRGGRPSEPQQPVAAAATGQEEQEEEEGPLRSDELSHNEVVVFDSWAEYSVATGRWRGSERLEAGQGAERADNPRFWRLDGEDLVASRYTQLAGRGLVRFMRTRCGRQFCLHPNFVDPARLEPAWAQTVFSYQGQEEDCVVALLPPEPGPFGMPELHVALSRARRTLVVYGERAWLRRLAFNAHRRPNSVLPHLLRVKSEAWSPPPPPPPSSLQT